MKKRRIMIVTYSYKPVASPRAYRWSAIAEYWAAEGHEVHIVAAQRGDLSPEEWCQGVHVCRVGEGVIGRLRRHMGTWRDRCTPLNGDGVGDRSRRLSGRPAVVLRRGLTWLYDHTWKKVWWPDYATLWYRPAVRKVLELVGQYDCDTLITSSHPFTDHLVGMRVKHAHPELPWLVDIGDPFSFLNETPCNNRALYRGLNYRVERRVFEKADGISVTNEVTGRMYGELFPTACHRIRVIPPLVRPEVEATPHGRVFPEDERLRLVFIGRLYGGIRTPQRLLAMFQKLLETPLGTRLELHIVGWTTGCEGYFDPYRAVLGKKLFLHGAVDHDTARRAMNEAGVLVNIGNTTSYQLPSKLVEYARTGHPILNLASTPDDSSASLLRTYPAAMSLFPLEGQAERAQWAALLQFLEHPPQVDMDELRAWLKAFETESIIDGYERLIEAGLQAEPAPAPGHHFGKIRWMRRSV
jgi:glycosyltransferase involved in cell wall biosynthesis